MAEVAKAYVSLIPETKGWGPKVSSQIGGDLDAAGRSGGKRLGAGVSGGFLPSIKGLMGPVAALFAVGAVTSFFKSANDEARESQKVGALTANVIKVTGGAAKITTGQVGDLSTEISNMTGVDDEAVQSGANLLLTFKNVRNEVGKGSQIFNRATAAAVDLSAAGFGSVEGSSKMLGKALNDPIAGITALGRAGVTFSAGQKKQIEGFVKAGDLLSAQKIIMKEVESQVGGAAAASATAGEKLSTTFGNFKEMIGTALLPIIDTVMGKVSGFLTFLMTNVGPAVAAVGAGFVAFGGFLSSNATTLGVLAGVITAVFLPALIRMTVQATISAAAQVAAWATTAAGAIAATVSSVAQFVIQGAKWAWMGVQALLGAAKIALAWVISMGPIAIVAAAVVGLGVLIFKNMDTIKGWIGGAWTWVKTTTKAAWDWVLSTTQSVWGAVTGFFAGIPAKVSAAIQGVIGFVKTVFSYTPLGIVVTNFGAIVSFFTGVPARIVSAMGNLGSLLFNKGKEVIQGLIDGIKSMVGNIGSAMGDVMGKIADFLPGSPVKEGPLKVLNNGYAGGQIVKMLAGGIDSEQATLEAQMRGLVSVPRVGSLDFASSADRAGAVAGSTGADVVAAIEQLGRVFGAELDRQARTIQTMQRQMA